MIIMVEKKRKRMLAVKNLGGVGTPRLFSPTYDVLYQVQDLDWLAEPGWLCWAGWLAGRLAWLPSYLPGC